MIRCSFSVGTWLEPLALASALVSYAHGCSYAIRYSLHGLRVYQKQDDQLTFHHPRLFPQPRSVRPLSELILRLPPLLLVRDTLPFWCDGGGIRCASFPLRRIIAYRLIRLDGEMVVRACAGEVGIVGGTTRDEWPSGKAKSGGEWS